MRLGPQRCDLLGHRIMIITGTGPKNVEQQHNQKRCLEYMKGNSKIFKSSQKRQYVIIIIITNIIFLLN